MSTKKKRELRRAAPMRRGISTSPEDSAEHSYNKQRDRGDLTDRHDGDSAKFKKRKKQK